MYAATIKAALIALAENRPWKGERPFANRVRRLQCPGCAARVLFLEIQFQWGTIYIDDAAHYFETTDGQTPCQAMAAAFK